jgi:hypothetical protein
MCLGFGAQDSVFLPVELWRHVHGRASVCSCVACFGDEDGESKVTEFRHAQCLIEQDVLGLDVPTSGLSSPLLDSTL